MTLDDADGASVLDVLIPAGAYDKTLKVGWKANAKGTKGTYSNASGVGGINKVGVGTTPKVPGLLRGKVTGKNGSYGAPWALPLTSAVVLDPGSEATGQCVEATFAESPPAPTRTFDGARLKYK